MAFRVVDIARQHGAARPSEPALLYGERTISYGELDERSSRVANALLAAGVQPQDRVALLDKNAPEGFEVIFGALKVSAVPCPVNWRLAPDEVAFIVNDAAAPVLVVGEELLPVVRQIEGQLESVHTIVVIGKDSDGGHDDYESWLARHAPDDPGTLSAVDDVVLQFYSSGTTGRPKGVMLTNGSFASNFETNTDVLHMSTSSVNLVAMPMFHVAGGAWGLLGLYIGCPNVLLREADPHAVLHAIATHRCTHGVLVPALIQFILALPETATADLSSMEYLIYGASPVSTDVLTRAIETFGCHFLQAYGMTETTGGCVLLPAEDHALDGPNTHRLRAAGRAAPNTELRVVDAELRDVPTGEVGEVLIRTAQNMKGYWNQPEETAKTLVADGWLRTGDAGYLDADGYLYIHDRVKDMIISGGENVYPAEVEDALMHHPAIADVAVIGVPHERWGETPKAVVVTAPGAALEEAEVIAFARERLAHFKCPTSVDFVDALPRNPSGKVLKRELRAPYWEGRDRRVN